jgi:hypothetical protein
VWGIVALLVLLVFVTAVFMEAQKLHVEAMFPTTAHHHEAFHTFVRALHEAGSKTTAAVHMAEKGLEHMADGAAHALVGVAGGLGSTPKGGRGKKHAVVKRAAATTCGAFSKHPFAMPARSSRLMLVGKGGGGGGKNGKLGKLNTSKLLREGSLADRIRYHMNTAEGLNGGQPKGRTTSEWGGSVGWADSEWAKRVALLGGGLGKRKPHNNGGGGGGSDTEPAVAYDDEFTFAVESSSSSSARADRNGSKKSAEIFMLRLVQGCFFTLCYVCADVMTHKHTYEFVWRGRAGLSTEFFTLCASLVLLGACLVYFPRWVWDFNMMMAVPPYVTRRDHVLLQLVAQECPAGLTATIYDAVRPRGAASAHAHAHGGHGGHGGGGGGGGGHGADGAGGHEHEASSFLAKLDRKREHFRQEARKMARAVIAERDDGRHKHASFALSAFLKAGAETAASREAAEAAEQEAAGKPKPPPAPDSDEAFILSLARSAERHRQGRKASLLRWIGSAFARSCLHRAVHAAVGLERDQTHGHVGGGSGGSGGGGSETSVRGTPRMTARSPRTPGRRRGGAVVIADYDPDGSGHSSSSSSSSSTAATADPLYAAARNFRGNLHTSRFTEHVRVAFGHGRLGFNFTCEAAGLFVISRVAAEAAEGLAPALGGKAQPGDFILSIGGKRVDGSGGGGGGEVSSEQLQALIAGAERPLEILLLRAPPSLGLRMPPQMEEQKQQQQQQQQQQQEEGLLSQVPELVALDISSGAAAGESEDDTQLAAVTVTEL